MGGGGGVGDRVPVGDARLGRLRRHAGLPAAHRDGEVVAERLADRARIQRGAETGDLAVLHRVAVLVDDHLAVLGVVHAALAQGDVGLIFPEEGVVAAVLVDPQLDLALVDRAQPGAEAERLDVLLRGGHPVVAHDLLELVAVAVPGGKGPAHRLRGLAGLALDRDVAPGQAPRAVQVGKRDRAVGGSEARAVQVLVVGEGLVPGALDRVRVEDRGRGVGGGLGGHGGDKPGRGGEGKAGDGCAASGGVHRRILLQAGRTSRIYGRRDPLSPAAWVFTSRATNRRLVIGRVIYYQIGPAYRGATVGGADRGRPLWRPFAFSRPA